jgi:hypothetical protein
MYHSIELGHVGSGSVGVAATRWNEGDSLVSEIN